MSGLKKSISDIAVNFRGPRIGRKIVVFESDDWGNIRMPSRAVQEDLIKMGFPFERRHYERVDSIAREDDLEALFSLLSRYRDINGNHPVITAMTVMANPDFDKIKESGFTTYSYSCLKDVLRVYSKGANSIFDLWEEGRKEKVFYPQFHGREHINVCQWMRDLKTKSNDNRLAFDLGIPGFFERTCHERGNVYAKALKIHEFDDIEFIKESIEDGLDLFETTFGYKSKSFMAPSYTWNDDVEHSLNKKGVKYIQSVYYQNCSLPDGGNEVRHHYFGQKNKLGQYYLLRNCSFEPSQCDYSIAVVDTCLNEIAMAFRLGKPATISVHRLNFIGAIHEENREKSLTLLDSLLTRIMNKWPDVEFMTSVELGDLLITKN